MSVFKYREVVEKHGSVEYHYLRRYLGNLPFGDKIILHTFDKLLNGEVRYTEFEKGVDIKVSGNYKDSSLNSPKIGMWRYERADKDNYSEEMYDKNGVLVRSVKVVDGEIDSAY